MSAAASPRGAVRWTIGAAVAQTTLGMVPAFLVGALAIEMRDDFRFPAAQVGAAVMAFFVVSAISYTLVGRPVERWGPRRATWTGAAVAAASLLVIGAASGPVVVAAGLLLGGLGNAVSQLAANVRITTAVPVARRGLALGAKQGAVPLATVVAGLALPLISDHVSWRVAFVATPLTLLLVLAMVPSPSQSPVSVSVSDRNERGARLRSRRTHLWTLAVAAALGTAGTNTLAIFFVDATVGLGVAAGTAGALLATGSAAGAVLRILMGARADRRGARHLITVSTLLWLSAMGFAGMASGWGLAVHLLAATVAFGASWGWNGLLNLAVITANPETPAQATAITQTGVSIGSGLGPALAGSSVGDGTFAVVWVGCAVASVVAAVLTRWARRAMRASAPPTTGR